MTLTKDQAYRIELALIIIVFVLVMVEGKLLVLGFIQNSWILMNKMIVIGQKDVCKSTLKNLIKMER
jgi:hypothetical protein